MIFNDVTCPICGHITEYDSYRKSYMCTKSDCNWHLQINDNYLKALSTKIITIIFNQKEAFTIQSIYDKCRETNLVHPDLRYLIKCKLDVLEDNGVFYYRNGRYKRTEI